MRIQFFFLLILCLSVCKAQNKAKNDYLNYHHLVAKAEHLFLSNKPDSSIIVYKEVFRQFPVPFAKDCFSAAQISCSSNNYVNSFTFLKAGIKRGIKLSLITNNVVLAQIKNKYPAQWKNLIKEYPALRKSYLESINIPLKKEMDKYYMQVQNLKNIPYTNTTEKKQSLDQIHDIEKKVIEIIKKNGWPGEQKIGIEDNDIVSSAPKNETELRDEESISSQIGILCFAFTICTFFEIKPYLVQAIKDGELSPEDYAMLAERPYVNNRKPLPGEQVDCLKKQTQIKYNIIYNFDTVNIAKVNRDRFEIGLGSYQDQVLKFKLGCDKGIQLRYGHLNGNPKENYYDEKNRMEGKPVFVKVFNGKDSVYRKNRPIGKGISEPVFIKVFNGTDTILIKN